MFRGVRANASIMLMQAISKAFCDTGVVQGLVEFADEDVNVMECAFHVLVCQAVVLERWRETQYT